MAQPELSHYPKFGGSRSAARNLRTDYATLHDFTGGTRYGTALYGGNSECYPISGCSVDSPFGEVSGVRSSRISFRSLRECLCCLIFRWRICVNSSLLRTDVKLRFVVICANAAETPFQLIRPLLYAVRHPKCM